MRHDERYITKQIMIQITESPFPIGTIIVPAGITPRYYEFTQSLANLQVPAGSKILIERSCDITQNLNKGIKQMIGDWIWILGDDHGFAPDLLLRLLGHNKDVVVPITPCKVPPWMPCVMHGPAPGHPAIWHEDMLLYDWDELGGMGLLEFPKGDFIGQAGMLVKKPVLDAIGYPWFKCGQLDPGRLQEDMMFCHDIQKAGYTVWIDQEVIFDHYFIAGVTARRHQGKWVPALKMGPSVMVLPDAKPRYNTDAPSVGGKPPLKWLRLPNENDYIKSVEKVA